MEFRTRKEIVYRIKNKTACTYDVDDTPPFPINREALGIAIEISLLSKLNIVGEVHITRKQYLDGSIPTGFQRTAIIGVEGEIYLKNRPIRLIQLSIEEDSCREISDIGHRRIYQTDRLGMPLIETVTYPEMLNPDEVMEACNYIRFLNRSTGKVRTGIGAGRQDVNVSCKGGTRVEIKGVSRTKWIPELTHNECFRQWALLIIKDKLNKKISDIKTWSLSQKNIDFTVINDSFNPIVKAKEKGFKLVAINLPEFKSILSHFTQPGKMFADELSDRLKVIACIEKPNMIHSEAIDENLSENSWEEIKKLLGAAENDAQVILWGPEADIKTAVETVDERCKMAFTGVPNETRKALENGITIFERVLPGADRMYPDTDSKPIPLENEYIDNLHKNLPTEVIERYKQLKAWGIPEDTYTYLFKRNLYPLIERIVKELGYDPKYVGSFLGHKFKYIEGHYKQTEDFNLNIIFALFKYLKDNNLDVQLIWKMIHHAYQYQKMDCESILTSLKFKKTPKEEIISAIPYLKKKFNEIRVSKNDNVELHWVMGQLRKNALGNIDLKELADMLNHTNNK
jgi:glutamyl-tRNA(Gln) amidotransferase subunit E